MTSILFVLKYKKGTTKVDKQVGLSTGLYNSAIFLSDMLIDNGITSNVVVVQDSKEISKEILKYKPNSVIIEALWVSPINMTELVKLHPSITWIIRIHSEMPFMAGEEYAFDWIGEYSKFKNVIIGVNSPRMFTEIKCYVSSIVKYLPNYYPIEFTDKTVKEDSNHIDIGCFGAIRPLKNHLIQAFSAIKFADHIKKKLRFHINADRIEMMGSPVLHNLMDMFYHLYDKGHRLVSHKWEPRDRFLETCALMDIGMQVSFSETFNIVAADFVSKGVPVLCSAEIPWASNKFSGIPTSSEDIFNKLLLTYKKSRKNVKQHRRLLTNYVHDAECIWTDYFRDTK